MMSNVAISAQQQQLPAGGDATLIEPMDLLLASGLLLPFFYLLWSRCCAGSKSEGQAQHARRSDGGASGEWKPVKQLADFEGDLHEDGLGTERGALIVYGAEDI